MAGPWTSAKFPQFEQAIRRLTEQHRELEDEPLHLAISYHSPREQEDIFLLEVIGSAEDSINPEKELFETIFEPTSGLPTDFTRRVHLVLTNLAEIKMALAQSWPSVREIVQALRTGEYKVLYKDAVGERALKRLREVAKRQEEASRG